MDVLKFSDYEWVLTNSLGGYALGASNMINRRKYHGLLVSSDKFFKRTHLVSSIEELVNDGESDFYLDSSNYPGITHPEGCKRIKTYFLAPYPCFVYSGISPGGGVLIVKTIKMHPEKNVSSVNYKNTGGKTLSLVLRPKFSMRDHHSVTPPGSWNRGVESEIHGREAKLSAGGADVFVSAPAGALSSDMTVYRNVSYITEILRGYESSEDLAAPFKISFKIAPGQDAFLLFSADEPAGAGDLAAIEKRYSSLPLPCGHPYLDRPGGNSKFAGFSVKSKEIFSFKDYIKTLENAFLGFIANDDLNAGYPWFSAWGRDTMISLEAFNYLPGLEDLRGRILLKYARAMDSGIIPNTIGEGGAGANYDTVDASLWFGIRAMEFLQKNFGSLRRELSEKVSEVIRCYIGCKDLPFAMDDSDGLITLKTGTDLGLTWMDAKTHGVPATPRYGKPVEINCLWYNLLSMAASGTGENLPQEQIKKTLEKTEASLKNYFDGGTFSDRISETGEKIKELRPNYVIGLSLPFCVFSEQEITAGYLQAKQHLLTPFGLRSLSSGSPAFRGKYMGSQTMRDLAYHQGTVWVWLLLPLAKTAAKIYKKEILVNELEPMVYSFRKKYIEGDMAAVPEIYDGDNPNIPKGAPAQCWSTAALLIIEKMIEEEGVL